MAVQGLRLSPQQKRAWLAQTAQTPFRSYAIIRLEGAVEADTLYTALQRVVARHEILRTVYRRVPGVPVPLQHIQERNDLQWEVVENAGSAEALSAMAQQHASTDQKVDQGALLHATLLRDSDSEAVLVLSLPSVSADHITLNNLVQEIALAYGGELSEESDEDVAQYADFSEWQHELLEDEDAAAGKSYWHKQGIGDLPSLSLPWAVPLSPKTPVRMAQATLPMAPEVTAMLRANGDSPRYALFAAWQLLVWRLTQASPVLSGYAFTGRQHEELERALGLFSILAPVKATITPDMHFGELTAQVEKAVADAEEWQEHYPWAESATPNPHTHYFPFAFEYQETPAATTSNGVTFTLTHRYHLDRADAKLTAFDNGETVTLEIIYHAETLHTADAERLLAQYHQLVRHLLSAPEAAVGSVDIVTESEYAEAVTTFNQTATDYDLTQSVHALFEAQAANTPDAVALVHPDATLTFGELNSRANQVAHYLRRQGVDAETIVAIRTHRSPEMVVALLGVLKAGAAYVPLDLLYPAERTAFMLSDTRAPFMLTQATLAQELGTIESKAILLDSEWQQISQEPTTNPAVSLSPESIAYVLYTSGSTGEPKGVLIPHRALSNYLQWATATYHSDGGSTPVHTPIGFDLTVTSLFTPLLAGKSVLLLSDEQGVDTLGDVLMSKSNFSLVKLTPSHLDLLSQVLAPDTVAQSAHTFVVGGEQLRTESVRFWRTNAPNARLINEYGPTETTVGCCVYELPSEELDATTVPIGRPIANMQIYLLDAYMRPVPLGAEGEIYLGGSGVARGYLNRPRQTAERFVPNPFSDSAGARLYKTGDVARFLPNADHSAPDSIEFIGRNDHQVKIRGYRIELDEVGAALNRYPDVQESVIVAHAEGLNDKRLVAYFTTRGDAPLVDDLRDFMNRSLPDYMIPSLFIRLEKLPLTANGKVDLRALPAPHQTRPEMQVAYQAPTTALEIQLADIWGKTLGIERIGVQDSFFSLGGDSIRSVRAVALAKEEGIEFSVQTLFQHPTIAKLTEYLASQTPTDAESDDDELARLLDELEGMSDEDVQNRLQSGS